MKFPLFLFSILIIIINFEGNSALDVEKELTLTSEEKKALDQFKLAVGDIVVEDYLKSDINLIRWLRGKFTYDCVKNLNLQDATESFMENLVWRTRNSIDGILDEDWSYFEENYFFDDSGTDFQGRPVIAADISEWDVRHAVLSGQGDKLLRYMIKNLESASQRVRSLQEKGKNVTQWQVILNMDNFNLFQHGCLQCLPIYLQFITAHENYYPFGADKIFSINTPQAFEVVLNLVRPIMSPHMRQSLTVFGNNKNEWKAAVLQLIPQDQLPPHFGGTKK